MASFSASTTASFVTDILQSAGRLDKTDLNARVGELFKKIEEVKVEVYDSLQKKYADFYPNLTVATDLQQKVNELQKEMTTTQNNIQSEIKGQLTLSTSEFQNLSSRLDETNFLLSIVEKIAAISERRKAMEVALNANDYVKAAIKLDEIQKLMDVKVHDREEEVHIFSILKTRLNSDKQKLIHDLREIWLKSVKWTLPKDSQTAKNFCTLSLSTVDKDDKTKIENTVAAMDYLAILQPELEVFGERVLKYIIKPILDDSPLDIKECDKQIELRVKLKNESSKSAPYSTFKDVVRLVDFLKFNLFSYELSTGGGKVKLMQRLGEIIAQDFTNLFIEGYLAKSIPSSKQQLEEYNKVIIQTDQFEAKLRKDGFLLESTTALTDYASNINMLFANKKSQEILQRARDLMTSDLHNVVLITTEQSKDCDSNQGTEATEAKKSKKTTENQIIAKNNHLSASTFKLPTIKVSFCIESLMSMAYEVLQEAVSSTPDCAIQLFYTVRNMFELFCNVVPTYHKQNLTDLPQLSAIHHNNCMYISHHLLTLGHQYRGQLPEPLASGAATFVDMVPKIRRLGTETFLHQMTKQKDQLLEFISSANGFLNVCEDDNLNSVKRVLEQVLFQLNHLSKVWKGILPSNIYNKAIGTLLNSVLVEICSNIISMEDISTDDAAELYSLCNIITSQSPLLFTPPQHDDKSNSASATAEAQATLLQHVSKWSKFSEVQLVLNSGLQDIADRWAEGKGPLAHELGANEVKQLIRALFQNTDRRAVVLSKIR